MKQLTSIQNSIELLGSYGDLGINDLARLNTLSLNLDNSGRITSEQACRLLFDDASADAKLRALHSRVKNAIRDAHIQAEQNLKGEPNNLTYQSHYKCMQAFMLVNTRKRGNQPKQLYFDVLDLPENIPLRANDAYLPEHFTKTKAVPDEISIFISYARETKPIALDFYEKLQTIWKAHPLPVLNLWMDLDIPSGNHFDQTIKEKMLQADYGVALLSTAFFDSDYILDNELPYFIEQENLLPLSLVSAKQSCSKLRQCARDKAKRDKQAEKINKLLDLQWFEMRDRSISSAYSDCHTEESKAQFVTAFIKSKFSPLLKSKQYPEEPHAEIVNAAVDGLNAMSKLDDYRPEDFENTKGSRTLMLDTLNYQQKRQLIHAQSMEEELEPPDRVVKEIDVLEDLLNWSAPKENVSTHPLYALLGDFGMGKTFTCREFTRRFNLQQSERQAFYIDLRDMPSFHDSANGLRIPSFEDIIEKTLSLAGREKSAEVINMLGAQIKDGQMILVMDGLDERLTRYSKAQQKEFMDEVFKILRDGEGKSQAKIVLSCRTHYFASFVNQSSFFLDSQRGGATAKDYHSVELLPFDDEQMQHLLHKLLDELLAKSFWTMLHENPRLKDLASRPWLLHKLPDIQQQIQRLAQQEGSSQISLADIYQALIDDTLLRDDEKHVLQPRHKQRFLQDLAAHLWLEGTTGMHVDELNDWYQAWLSHTELREQYNLFDNEVLEKDIRNSSLLVRSEQDSFNFGHTSMQEFFLAKWWLYQLENNTDDLNSIEQLPNQESVDFLTQLVGNSRKVLPLIKSVQRLLADNTAAVPLRALALHLLLKNHSFKAHHYQTLYLAELDLSDQGIADLHCETLILSKTKLEHSEWRNITSKKLILENTDLSRSNWLNCNIASVQQEPCRNKNYQALMVNSTNLATQIDAGTLQHLNQPSNNDCNTNKTAFWDKITFGHTGNVSSVAISADGCYGLSGSSGGFGEKGEVLYWNLSRGEVIARLEGVSAGVDSVAISADGRYGVSGGSDGLGEKGELLYWDLLRGELIARLEGGSALVRSVSLSADGRYGVSGGSGGLGEKSELLYWDLSRGEVIARLEEGSAPVHSVSMSADGRYGLSVSSDSFRENGDLMYWDLLQGRLIARFEGAGVNIRSVSLSADGRYGLISSRKGIGEKGELLYWDLSRGELIARLEGGSVNVCSVSLSADSHYGLSGGSDHLGKNSELLYWDLWRGEVIARLEVGSAGVDKVSLSADGRYGLTGGGNRLGEKGELVYWDLSQGEIIACLKGTSIGIRSVSLSADGLYGLSNSSVGTGEKGELLYWDLLQGEVIACLEESRGGANKVSLSADGRYGLSVSSDDIGEKGELLYWDLSRGELIARLEGGRGDLDYVSLSADGRYGLISSSGGIGEKGELLYWDLSRGEIIARLEGASFSVRSVSLSADGRYGFSGGSDHLGEKGELLYWDLSRGELITRLEVGNVGVRSVSLSANGRYGLSGGSDIFGVKGELLYWDLSRGELIASLKGISVGVRSVSLSADGRYGLSGGGDVFGEKGELLYWDLLRGELITSLNGSSFGACSVSLSADGRHALGGALGGQIFCWDLSKREIKPIKVLQSLPDRQWLSIDTTGQRLTATEQALRYVNFSDGKETWGIQDCQFDLVLSEPKPFTLFDS